MFAASPGCSGWSPVGGSPEQLVSTYQKWDLLFSKLVGVNIFWDLSFSKIVGVGVSVGGICSKLINVSR